jgi:hypothetical protein
LTIITTKSRACTIRDCSDLVGQVRCIPSAEADAHEKDYNLCDFEIGTPAVSNGVRKPPRDETAGKGAYWAVPRGQLWGTGLTPSRLLD